MKALKRHLPQLCLFLCACCVALLLAEVLVRLFFPHSRDHVIPGGLFEIDNHLGWRLRAARSAAHSSRYFDVTYEINALGYRDRPREVPKGKGLHRILLYGDSQIFGWGIAEDQRFSNLMEARSSHLEAWNMAVPGYGVDQQILSYESYGQRFAADEVMFFVSTPTLSRLRQGRIYHKAKPRFVIDRSGELSLVAVPRRSQRWRRHLYQALSPFYLPYFVERRLARWQPTATQPGAGRQAAAVVVGELEQRLLDRARMTASARGHRTTVLSVLPAATADPLRAYCERAGVGFLEIVSHGEASRLTFGEHDRHWNVRAHRLIADQLLSHLATRGGDAGVSTSGPSPLVLSSAPSRIALGNGSPPYG